MTMARILSFDIETDASPGGKVRNPYGPEGGGSSSSSSNNNFLSPNTARAYFMFALAIFVLFGIGKLLYPADTQSSEYDGWKKLKGDASGGWGMKHNHPVVSNNYVDRMSADRTPPFSLSSASSSSSSIQNTDKVPGSTDNAEYELWESDLLQLLSPIIVIPNHPRHEYHKYQTKKDPKDTVNGNTAVAVEILYDKSTPHGKAFDFLLNRDTRPHRDDVVLSWNDLMYLRQRFVMTLLFYATGGRDTIRDEIHAFGMEEEEEEKKENEVITNKGSRGGGWEATTAHFLTGLHECHWVKKSSGGQLWNILSIDKDMDTRVGVTKCNADMEVTEIRLAELNLVGFIPEEIKWLSSLEYLDLQNNHLSGPIPKSLGLLGSLRYLSLDGNSLSGTIPDVFHDMVDLERAFFNFNDFNSSIPPSICNLREDGALKDLWSDCGGYPITCTCCTVCCDMVAECSEIESEMEGG